MPDPSEQIGAVLLFGPPGVGKSTFSAALLREHGKHIYKFINVGAELRSRGLVDEYQEHPTEEARCAMTRTARELLETACAELMAPSSAACSCPRRVKAQHIVVHIAVHIAVPCPWPATLSIWRGKFPVWHLHIHFRERYSECKACRISIWRHRSPWWACGEYMFPYWRSNFPSATSADPFYCLIKLVPDRFMNYICTLLATFNITW